MMAASPDVQYLVLPDSTNPYLLARVRWPDIYQAISPVRPDWQDDIGLFDLPYNSSSTTVTLEQANAIAAEWGARLPGADSRTPDHVVMRRMPADWSNLSRAEKRWWSIQYVASGTIAPPGSESARRRRGRRRNRAASSRATAVIDLTARDADIIDLTDARGDALATAEDE